MLILIKKIMSTEIEGLFRLRLADFKFLLKHRDELPEGVPIQGAITYTRGITQFVVTAIFVKSTLNHKGYLILEWKKTDGKSNAITIEMLYRKTNLNKGSEGYFICPNTQKWCRTLYSDCDVVVSRYAFKGIYRAQKESKKWRVLASLSRDDRIVGQKYRKRTYRGRLTPYGIQEMKAQDDMDFMAVKFLGLDKPHKKPARC